MKMRIKVHSNKFISNLLFLMFTVIVLCGTAAGVPLSSPTGLLTNGESNPMAVDSGYVVFTWKMKDSERGSMQTSYQILVALSKKNIDNNIGDIWNSGKVSSSRTAGVVYEGKAGSAATRYWWKVRVWDNHGKVSTWSRVARFDVGLSKSDWTADYIWDGTMNQNDFAYFRKSFIINKAVKKAKVYVSAHNDYKLYFNGHLLGRGPGRSDPYHYGQYNAYEITKLVKIGKNVIAAIGHWQGTWNNAGVNAKPAFILEARMDYSNGSSSSVGTDGSWKVLTHTPFIETNATYFPKMGAHVPSPTGSYRWTIPGLADDTLPEFAKGGTRYSGGSRAAIQFDSRREPTGWKEVGFDDSGWANATLVDRSKYNLFAQRAPLEREQAELKPVSIRHIDGAWVVNFGQCIDGWPKLVMHANGSGDTVCVHYFQMKGEQYPAGGDEYVCHGGKETWDADFGRHTSFQVLKISGYAGELKPSDIRGIWAYCDADVAGDFRCSSPLLNAIYKMCERSARQNVQQGIISVDANREQASWLADSWNIGNVLLYNDGNTMMVDKVVRDYGMAQLPNGNFPACSPAQQFSQIPEWAMYWPMLLWQQYLFSGDTMLLRGLEPHLIRLLKWLKAFQSPDTKLLNPPGWRISEFAGGNMPSGGYNIATNCQYYKNLRIASRIFSVLGQPYLSDEYWQQAETVKASINSNLFNSKFYLSRTDRKEMYPLASAWALRFNIESDADKSRILDAIEKGGKPNIGGYGGDALYSGMLNAGAGGYVVRDLARYRPMLEGNKATWEGFIPGRGEVNHAWTSYPGYLFQKYILGVQPTSGGFATFDIRPVTSGLTYAEGAVPTVKGLITSRWEKSDKGQFSLSVHIPANSRAAIYIPKSSQGKFTLTESGKLLRPAQLQIKDPGVLTVSDGGSFIKCLVGSGDYHFHILQD